MESVLAITRALADENRVRALLVLDGRELCVCQLIEFLGLAPSTVSKHMTILRQARLIEGRKKGRWMNYRLAGSACFTGRNGGDRMATAGSLPTTGSPQGREDEWRKF